MYLPWLQSNDGVVPTVVVVVVQVVTFGVVVDEVVDGEVVT